MKEETDCTKNNVIRPLKPVEKEVKEIPIKIKAETSIKNQNGINSEV